MNAHLTIEGEWQACQDSACQLRIHLPNLTAPEARALPMAALLPLLEVFDPPDDITDEGVKIWWTEWEGRAVEHRDYDLPAVIHPSGKLEWYEYGTRWRYGDRRPTVVNADGTQTYMQGGPKTERMRQETARRIAKWT